MLAKPMQLMLSLQSINYCLIHVDCCKCTLGVCGYKFILPSDFANDMIFNSTLSDVCNSHESCDNCPSVNKYTKECIWAMIWNHKILKSYRGF